MLPRLLGIHLGVALLALLAYGSNPDTFALVRWLPRVAQTSGRRAVRAV